MEGDIKEDNGIKYQERNGIFWHLETPPELCFLLAQARVHNIRLKFYFGDTKTGRYWGDVEVGKIGRSTGDIKIPLVIKNARSMGGGALLDHCILRVERAKGGAGVWLHPSAKFSLPLRRAVIHVHSGVAYEGRHDKDVEVSIIDHDNEGHG